MSTPTAQDIVAEGRKVRRLQLMIDLVMSIISQSRAMPVEEASQMVASTRRAALEMFPGQEHTYDLIYGADAGEVSAPVAPGSGPRRL